ELHAKFTTEQIPEPGDVGRRRTADAGDGGAEAFAGVETVAFEHAFRLLQEFAVFRHGFDRAPQCFARLRGSVAVRDEDFPAVAGRAHPRLIGLPWRT